MVSTDFITPRKIAATITADTTLDAGTHHPVNASGGPVVLTLPLSNKEGSSLSVAKTDVSANTVTISGVIDGVSTTRVLSSAREAMTFTHDSGSSWWVTSSGVGSGGGSTTINNITDVPTVTLRDDFNLAVSVAAGAIGTAASVTGTAYDNTIGNGGNNNGLVSAQVSVGQGVFSENAILFHVGAGATGAFGFLGKNITIPANGKMFFRRFYKPSVLPSFRTSIFMLKSTDVNGAHIVHFALGGTTQSNKWCLVNVDTTVTGTGTVSAATISTGVYTRADIFVDTVLHTISVDLFYGTNLTGLLPNETISTTYTAPPLPAGFVEDGIMTNPNVALDLSLSHPINGNAWIPPDGRGPVGPAGPTGPTGSAGLVLMAAGDPNPASPVTGVLYAKKVV